MKPRLKPLIVLLAACPLYGLAAEIPMLDEIVVTASPMSRPLTVVSDPKAPRQPVPAHDGADYLKSIPGFNVIRKGGTDGDPILRGMAGSRLNILMDDQHILGGCGMRMDPPTAYIFPEVYDRVTVLKGPQSVAEGANVAGAVKFERKKPAFAREEKRALLSATVGSWGRNDVVGDATYGNGRAYVRGFASHTDANDYQDGNGSKVHSAYTRWNAGAVGGWTPDRDTRVEVSLDASDGQAAYADRIMDGTKFAREGVGLKFTRGNLSPLIGKVEAQVFHNYIDHVMDNYTLRTRPAGLAMFNNPDRMTQGARVALGLNPGVATTLTVGAGYERNEHTLRTSAGGNVAVDAYKRLADLEADIGNVFVEVEHALDQRSRLLGGLRQEWFSADRWKYASTAVLSSAGETLTWKAGAEQNLTSAFLRYEQNLASLPATFYVGLGRAQRPMDHWEATTYEGLTNTTALRPESNTQLDIGLHYAAGPWRANLAAYHAQIDDYMLTRTSGTAGCLNVNGCVENIDASTTGFEADASWRINERWKTFASLAYVRGENDSGNAPLAQMPPLEGRLGAEYDDRTWSFGALLRGVAEQDRVQVGYGSIVGQDLGRTPGFAVFSLNAGWKPRKDMKLTAGVDNLFDKIHAEHISRTGAPSAVPVGYSTNTRVNEPGRTLWLKLNADF